MNTYIKSLVLIIMACCLSLTAAFSQINFTMDVSQGCEPLTVTFTNTSTVGSSYYIFFDDGNGDFWVGTDTTHTYMWASYFNVTLYAYDSLGNYIGSNYNTLQVDQAVTDFYMSDTLVCPGSNVGFSTYTQGGTYIWDFGDGDTASGQWADHIYSTMGVYNVLLIMDDVCGIDTLVKTVTVDSTGIPDAQFGFWPDPVCPLQPVNFYSYTSNGAAFYWDFGDGDTSTAEYPMHPYDTIGFFDITFVITNGCGNTDTNTAQIEVMDNAGWPMFNLNSNSPGCPGENLNIGAPGGYLAYIYTAGDGSPPDSTTEEWFNHVYDTLGTYIVSVKIYDYCGSDTTITDTVTVSGNVLLPNEPWFEIQTNNLVCPGEQLQMNGPGGFMAYVYDYGDGSSIDSIEYDGTNHTYSSVGSYVISLTIYNFCGNDSTIYDTIVVSSTAGFQPGIMLDMNSPICPGGTNFHAPNGMAMYVWDFGDGTPPDSSTWDGSEHNYDSLGTYPISVTIVNYCGDDTTLYDTLEVASNVDFPQSMYLNSYPNPVCPGDEVNLNAEYGFTLYEWNFGDGTTVTTGDNNVEHIYDSTGTYNYSVKMTNGCGLDTTVSAGLLVDANAPFPTQIELYTSSNTSCPGDAINFDADNDWALYFWDFGGIDTITTTEGRMSYTFDSVGVYDVSVTLWNGCGNQTTLTKTILIDSTNTFVDASIFALNQNVCPGDVIGIGPEDDDGTPYLYYWDLGDGTLDTTQGVGVSHSYDSIGVYTVSVIATNSCGFSATSNLDITVTTTAFPSLGEGDDFFGVATDGATAGCSGDAILFYFAGTYGNTWDFGDGSSASAVNSIQTPFGAFSVISHVYQSTGTYWAALTITNACGNSLTDSVQVVIGSGLAVDGEVFATPPTGGGAWTTCEGVTFLAMGGASYDWDYGDGTTLTTNSSQVTHYFDSAGTYTVNVAMTNSCGNTGSYSVLVDVIDGGGATATAAISNQITCYGGGDAIATATGTGGTLPYTYLWNDPAAQTTMSAANLSAGTYSVTVSDNVGCTGATSVTVADPAQITGTGSMTPASCAASDGSVSITSLTGGTAPYTYAWDNGDTTATADSLASGNYSVTVTDANGCSRTQSVTLSDIGGVTISGATITDATCPGGSDGTIDLTLSGGTAPFTYTWSSGDTLEDLTGLKEGTYTVTVTDAAGCNTIQSGSIGEPDPIAITTTVIDANCGVADGSIIAVASGGTAGYNYLWSNGTASSANLSLVAGAYNITITDASSCEAVYTVSVSNANAPAITSSVNDISCNGLSDGAIDLSVSGGTTPYTYLWLHNGSFTQDVSGLLSGSYTIILYDGGGCQTAQTFSVVEPDAISTSTSTTGVHCGYSDGSATATVAGGTAPHTYSWSTGGSSSTESGLGIGTTTLTLTDVNGCSAMDSATIATFVDDIEICVVTVDSTSSKNVVVWEKPSPPMGIESFNVYRDIVGTYTLIDNVTYNALSEYEDTTNGVNPNTTSYRYKISIVDSCANEGTMSAYHETVNLTPVVITGGNATLIWDNYEGLNFGFYRILRDTTGNDNWEKVDSVTNANFTYVDLNAPAVSNLRYQIEVVTASICVATKAKSYNSSKSNTSSYNNKTPMTSSVTSVDANQGMCNGTATITALAGTQPYTYIWSDSLSQTTATAVGLCAGNYDVTVYDADGDSLTGSAAIGTISGVNEFDLDKYLTIYPNPNTGHFSILITAQELELVTLKVYSTDGRVILDTNLPNIAGEMKEELDLSDSGPGIYFIQVISSRGTSVKKVIVQ